MTRLHSFREERPANARQFSKRGREPGRHGEQEPPPIYSPWLYIRYEDSVGTGRLLDGSVPTTKPFYLSPDIFFSPTDALGNPVAGTDVTVRARVFNGGLAPAVATFVEFYWFDPSFAIVAGNGNFIGSKLVTVPAGLSLDVTCPKVWTPTFVNGGHECLVVQCSCPGEGTSGLQFPFQAAIDRHVGQRNLNVSDSASDMSMVIAAPNPFDFPFEFQLRLVTTLVNIHARQIQDMDLSDIVLAVGQIAGGVELPKFQFEVTDLSDRSLGLGIELLKTSPMKQAAKKHLLGERFLSDRNVLAADVRADAFGRMISQFRLGTMDSMQVGVKVPPIPLGDENFLVHRIMQMAGTVQLGAYTFISAPVALLDRLSRVRSGRSKNR